MENVVYYIGFDSMIGNEGEYSVGRSDDEYFMSVFQEDGEYCYRSEESFSTYEEAWDYINKNH